MQSPKRFYKNMTIEKAKEIRRLYFEEKLKQDVIAALYGIPQGSVSRIVNERVWCRP